MVIACAGREDSPSGSAALHQGPLMSVPASRPGLLPLTGPFLDASSSMQMYAGGMTDQVGIFVKTSLTSLHRI